MNNFLNKIFCFCLGIFVFLHDIDAANCEQFLMKSNERQEKLLQGRMRSINIGLTPIIKDNASRIFNIYNCFIEYINEFCRFPIFFKIHEENFPKVLSYLSPNRKSIILMDNLLRVQDFFEKLYGNISEISQKFHSEKFRVYFMVDNPCTWTKGDYVGLDPENCNAYTDHRPLTSFIFGINASF